MILGGSAGASEYLSPGHPIVSLLWLDRPQSLTLPCPYPCPSWAGEAAASPSWAEPAGAVAEASPWAVQAEADFPSSEPAEAAGVASPSWVAEAAAWPLS